MRNLILFLFFGGIAINAIAQQEIKGKVTAILDGNTLEVTDQQNEKIRVVLMGVDSPEPGQAYADHAKKLLEKRLYEKEVDLLIKGKDRWGNYVGVVTKGKTDPRIELLEEGLAWTAEKNPLPELEQIRLEAQEKGLGIWQEKEPTPPWIYRRQQTMMQAKSF